MRFREIWVWHIGAEARWPPFCRRHFALDFPNFSFKKTHFKMSCGQWISIKISLNLFLGTHLTIFKHGFIWWLGAEPSSEQMIVSSLTHICVTRPQWVKAIFGRMSYIAQPPPGLCVCSAVAVLRGRWVVVLLYSSEASLAHASGRCSQDNHHSKYPWGPGTIRGSANERKRYYVTAPLTDRSHTQNDPWWCHDIETHSVWLARCDNIQPTHVKFVLLG